MSEHRLALRDGPMADTPYRGHSPFLPNMPFMSVNEYRPRFAWTPSIVRYLMEIEGAREVVDAVPLPAGIEATLRRRAKISSAHFSTKIEQNTLSYSQVEEVESNVNRSRDASTQEVRNYLRALQWIHDHAARSRITSQLFQQLHAMIEVRSQGRRPKQSPYRKIQNMVRDDKSGTIAYMPPESKDVPDLVNELAAWLNSAAKSLPVPVVAAVAQYQLVTIHPWMDGNGRTSRALGTLLLCKNGYDLKGFFSIEEQFDRDVAHYYDALQMNLHHNYYYGRNDPDLTPWLEFFLKNMAAVFQAAKDEVLKRASSGTGVVRDAAYEAALHHFATREFTVRRVAQKLGVTERTARSHIARWRGNGKATTVKFGRKNRSYEFTGSSGGQL
jgi:Fic family protein